MRKRLDELNLLGIDVGYSKRRRSTGIARCGPCGFKSGIALSCWSNRQAVIDHDGHFDLVAIDGPLLPTAAVREHKRECESALVRAPFHNRCKPGMSHFGQGLELRKAARATFEQTTSAGILRAGCFNGPWLEKEMPVVEAFPNAFLGVLLPDCAYNAATPLRRGRRFDWLFERCREKKRFEMLMDRLHWHDEALQKALETEAHHEKRAALICLLTAGCAAAGQAVALGDKAGGWIWLPPFACWQGWAQDALRGNKLMPI